MKFIKTLRFIMEHPLSRGRRLSAVFDWVYWQASRIFTSSPSVINFVDDSRLLVSHGMAGATGNIYVGLHEFEDMAFALHLLREGDVFFDIGANVGTYTVLSSAVRGARTVSVEPVPSTFDSLIANIRLNDIEGLVTPLNIAVSDVSGTIQMTPGFDTMNHVISDNETGASTITTSVKSLDEIALESVPTLLKIDVEGYETKVIEGASRLLDDDRLLAVLMELNGCGERYGFDEDSLHRRMLENGFEHCRYDPFSRTLHPIERGSGNADNTLYIRPFTLVQERVRSSPAFLVKGIAI